MDFVREIVPEEDVVAYALDDLHRRWKPWPWRDGRPAGFIHRWVIDRQARCFLLPVMHHEEIGASGRPEPTPTMVWVLHWDGEWWNARLRLAEDSSRLASDRPFRVAWELLSLEPAHAAAGTTHSPTTILSALRQALTSFGPNGSLRQMPETLVQFRF